ncbi:hypothetical protein BDR26DRAFT_903003 [Obelidium mucronatum]|nr:hypothetical protein BDR26DRAFT_903003 [Obelidium mucronatum]
MKAISLLFINNLAPPPPIHKTRINIELAEAPALFSLPLPLNSSSKPVRGEDKLKSHEWKNLNLYTMALEEFHKEVRVTRRTFDFRLRHIKAHLEKGPLDNPRGKPRTPAKDQLSMYLYFVSTGSPLRMIGQLFGYGIHTVSDSVRRVALAIIAEFQTEYIQLPDVNNNAEWERIAADFSLLGGLV